MSVLDHLRRLGWPRRALFALGLLLVLAVVVRVLLDPITSHFTRNGLNESEAVNGDFQSVHVTLFPPGHDIRRPKIIEAREGDWRHPWFYAERGFAQLPPPAASDNGGVLTQTAHALQKDKGPPKAQPPKTESRSGEK